MLRFSEGLEAKREKPPGGFVMNHHLAERFWPALLAFLAQW